jgi:hypothetical protein
MFRELSETTLYNGFLLVNFCGKKSFAELKEFVRLNKYFRNIMFLPSDYAKSVLTVKYKARVEDVKRLADTEEFKRTARMMGRLDPVVLRPRAPKSVVHGDLLVIDTIEIGPERMECASEEVSDLIERQGKMKEYLNSVLNALGKIFKVFLLMCYNNKRLNNAMKILFGVAGSFKCQIERSGYFKFYITLTRSRGASIGSILDADKPKLDCVHTCAILVRLVADASGNSFPDFRQVAVLFKKVENGSMTQVKHLLAHAGTLFDTPVSSIYYLHPRAMFLPWILTREFRISSNRSHFGRCCMRRFLTRRTGKRSGISVQRRELVFC